MTTLMDEMGGQIVTAEQFAAAGEHYIDLYYPIVAETLGLDTNYRPLLLDLGCADGALSEYLLRTGKVGRIIMVDLDEVLLDAARERMGRAGLLDRCEIIQRDLIAEPTEAPDEGIAMLSNITGYFTPDELVQVIDNIHGPTRLITNMFVEHLNLNVETMRHPLFMRVERRADGDLWFHWNMGWGEDDPFIMRAYTEDEMLAAFERSTFNLTARKPYRDFKGEVMCQLRRAEVL